MELYRRNNGALIAKAVHAEVPKARSMKRLGLCSLPAESLASGFTEALARDEWAIATGNDRALLQRAGHAIGYRKEHVAGTSLIETAIGLACSSHLWGASPSGVADA